MRLEFRTAEGQVCCSTSDPNHLCSKCAAAHRIASVPNPYGSIMRTAAAPDLGPGYQPFGVPPDGYALALAARTKKGAA